MSKFKVSDFYYGAVLSMLFSHGIKPALIENGHDRQVYDFTTDNASFRLMVKYRGEKIDTKKPDYSSWVFNISAEQKEIRQYINEGKNLILALVCGTAELGDSQLAVLDSEQLTQILDKGKTSFTINIKKGERAFRIPFDNDRENGIKVKCNRFEELF